MTLTSTLIHSLNDLRRQTRSKVCWLWTGYLVPGNVTLLTSQWKAGKTTLVALLLDRMKAGGILAGADVQPGKAIVLSEESPAHWVARSRKLDLGAHVFWVCRPFRGRPSLEAFQALLGEILALHAQVGLSLLVIDSLAAFLPARTENDATAVMSALLPLQQLTVAGLAILILHHPRKRCAADGQSARGSGALTGWADILLEMHWYGDPASDDRRRRLLGWSRHEATPRHRLIELTDDGLYYVVCKEVVEDPFLPTRSALWSILESARTKLTRRQILEAWPEYTPRPSSIAIWRLLERCTQQGELLHDGAGTRNDPFRYWIPAIEKRWQNDPMARVEQTIADAQREVANRLANGTGGLDEDWEG